MWFFLSSHVFPALCIIRGMMVFVVSGLKTFVCLMELKGYCTNSAHRSLFTGLREAFCIRGKSGIKPFVASKGSCMQSNEFLQKCNSVAKLHCGQCRQQVCEGKRRCVIKIDINHLFETVHNEPNSGVQCQTSGLLF